MRRFLTAATVVLATSGLVSCNSYNANSATGTTGASGSTSSRPSGLEVRAFISNPLEPLGIQGAFSNVLNIMDAKNDLFSFSTVDVSSVGTEPGLMALSPDKQHLLVFSSSQNTVGVVETVTERVATSSSGTAAAVSLPGPTNSMIIAGDNATGYAAVPSAPVTSGGTLTPGAVEVINLAAGSITVSLPVPAAEFVAGSHTGNRILAMGAGSNTVTIIAPSAIGTASDPRTTVSGFDHPVWAAFSADDNTAYILNCGPECGGMTAGISVLNMNTQTAGPILPLPGAGATVGLISNGLLYVAGSPPGLGCGSGTAAPTCGTLDIVNLSSMTLQNSSPIVITDGYHRRLEISANAQVFVGSTNCSNVTTSSETRGCLAIYNANTAKVVIPPDNGDVTGIQPIANRDVVYLCEGGNFRIYDTTIDKLQVPPVGQVSIVIVGKPTDVKEVD